ncbi:MULTISPECIES: hypothetical protein [Methanobacterium]|uniref:Uncharacterized protein n=1 Tax=Methanobacterium veterum TaxID=408577 RepID=A0A9E5A2X3_9EURY|nr:MULTISPECIES: hypothetical protein [Methanobacterium]MCZ3367255.1 hypothetical protein [Methanobacterium veterum]MCZ3373597.1 hypothetical protein [Methanobacterium veterum]
MNSDYPDIMEAFRDIEEFSGPHHLRKEHELIQVSNVLRNFRNYAEDANKYIGRHSGIMVSNSFQNLNNPATVEKNISWLTSVSALKLNEMKFTVDADDPETYDEIYHKSLRIQNQIKNFKNIISEGILVPIPTVIEEYDGINRYSRKYDLSKNVLDVKFSKELEFTEENLVKLQILLPNVENVPLSEILIMRKEYSDIFHRFQNKMMDYMSEFDRVSSVDKLFQTSYKLNEEIRRLNSSFKDIDHNMKLQRQGMYRSFGVMSLAFFVPHDLLPVILTLGGSELFRTLDNLRMLSFEKQKLQEDPFYMPYKLSKLAKKKSK